MRKFGDLLFVVELSWIRLAKRYSSAESAATALWQREHLMMML